MTTPELIDYIKSQLAAGQNVETISQALEGQGWSINDVAEAFNAIAAAGTAPANPVPVSAPAAAPVAEVSPNPSPVVTPVVTPTVTPVSVSPFVAPAAASAGISKALVALIIIFILAAVGGGAYYFLMPKGSPAPADNVQASNQNNFPISQTPVVQEPAATTTADANLPTASSTIPASNISGLACDKVFSDDVLRSLLPAGLSRVTNSTTPGSSELLFCSYNYTDNKNSIYVAALVVYPNSGQYEPSLALLKTGVGGSYTPSCEPSSVGIKSSLCTSNGAVSQILFVTSNNKYTAIVSLGSMFESGLNLSQAVEKMAKAVDSNLK